MPEAKILRSLIALAALCGCGLVSAAPVYYTFEGSYLGHVDNSAQSGSWGDFTNAAYSMTWMFDASLDGTRELNDGTVIAYSDFPDDGTSAEDYVFAELAHQAGFGVVQEIGGGAFNAPFHVASFNVAVSEIDTDPNDGFDFNFFNATAGPFDNRKILRCEEVTLASLALGSECMGDAYGYDDQGRVSIITTSLELISISNTPKVIPVPAALWLFASALIGLAGIGRRRKAA